jgi:hypothetical protein
VVSLSCHVVAHGVVTVLGIVPCQLGLQWTSQCSTGIFVSNALASLPALCWRYHQYCAVVFTRVAPASLPALHGHLCNLSPPLHPHCHKHCKLASAPSQCNRDMSAYMALSSCSLLSSVVFVIITSAVPRRLGSHVRPILRWWFCWHCTGVLARVALASLQASRC